MCPQIPLLYLNRPPFLEGLPWPLKIGSIFQQFSSTGEGKVQNIIKIGLNDILENEGLTLTVNSRFCDPPTTLSFKNLRCCVS